MSTGDIQTKNCTSEHPCQYRTIGNGFYGCGYCGYCDFQLPRDSRLQPFQPPNWDLGAKPYSNICPYCHLPYDQCKGHTICKGETNA